MYEFNFLDDDYDMYGIIYSQNPPRIFVDDAFKPDWCPCVRRPYYQMRGKRITEQQAFDIISKTDRLFSRELELEDSICSINFYVDWFSHGLCGNGWVHPNGIIGINDMMGKYPTVSEFAKEWATYLYHFPYLDLMIGVTWWDEHPFQIKQYEAMPFQKCDNFHSNIEAGIWVHDNRIEIVDQDYAEELYKKYEAEYGEKDNNVYFPEYYKTYQPDVITMEYLKKCLLTYGITDAETFLKEKLYRYNDILKLLNEEHKE